MHFKWIAGRVYLYESVRLGSRVTSRCYGQAAPEIVPLCRALDAECRRERAEGEAEARRRESAVVAPLAGLGLALAGYGREVDAAVATALGSLGYHRRGRGPWRKRRGATMEFSFVGSSRTKTGTLIRLARKGDALAREQLPAALLEAANRGGGDVQETTFHNLARMLPGGRREDVCEAIRARAELMRLELAPPGSTAIEELMAARVVADWLHCQSWEQLWAGLWNEGSKLPSDRLTATVQRHMNAAIRRYRSSLVAMAKVQQLALPVLVNQLNVAAPGSQVLNQAKIETTPALPPTRKN